MTDQSNMRKFTFMVESIDGTTLTQLEEMQGILSAVSTPLDIPGVTGTNVTIEFDPSMLMEVADDLSSLGFTEAEQNIFEENYDLFTEQDEEE